MHSRAAVTTATRLVRRADQHAQLPVSPLVRRLRPSTPGIEPTRGDREGPTQYPNREEDLLRADERERYALSFAKKAAAFFRISRSVRSTRFSFRNRRSSSRSSVVRPVRPFVRSARAWSTQFRSADSVASISLSVPSWTSYPPFGKCPQDRIKRTRLDQASKSKESFTHERDKLERGRTELTDFVRGHFERLTVERKELDAFDERLKALHSGLSHSEKRINSLQEREKDLGVLEQRTEGLEKRMTGLTGETEDLQKKQAALETLRDGLAQVDELTKRTSYQFGALEKSREDLEGLRKEIQEFYTTHAALSKTLDTLATDKKRFEGFLQRTDEFRRQIPVLDSKMDAIISKLSVVEEGTQKAATLVAVAEDLDRQMTRIAWHQQLVEKVEARLSTLNTLSGR